MNFGAPQFLYALAALPALMVFVRWALVRRAASVRRIGDPVLVERLSEAASRRMHTLRLVLWFVGVALIIVALARPQWGSDIEIVEQRGVQVMVALDVSRSMLAQDVKPTRLGRAKLEISDLISRLDGDEVGIVLFSGASFIQFPLTSDYATARTYLNHASPDSITRQGTVIAEAIETAMAGFSHQRAGQKIIVIMTDGENHEGDPIAAAQQAAGEGVVIYTVGFGSPDGEPLPEYDEEGNITGYRRDTQGGVITSKLDEGGAPANRGERRRSVLPGRRAWRNRRPSGPDTIVPRPEPSERVQPEEGRAVPALPARGPALAGSGRGADRPSLVFAAKTANGVSRGDSKCLTGESWLPWRSSRSSC